MADISKITLPDNSSYDIKDALARNFVHSESNLVIPIGICNDSANTINKTVTLENFILEPGSIFGVKFTADSSSGPMFLRLNVNNTGIKNVIMYYDNYSVEELVGVNSFPRELCSGNAIQYFFYDGNYYRMLGVTLYTENDYKTSTCNNESYKLYLVGGASQTDSVYKGAFTYSNVNCYIGTDNCLYSNSNKVSTGIELTQAEYDALPSTKTTDGVDYYITDAGSGSDTISASSVTLDDTTLGSTVEEALSNVGKIGEQISGTSLSTTITTSWTNNDSLELTKGTWVITGCMTVRTTDAYCTVRVSCSPAERESVYCPDNNTFSGSITTIYTVSDSVETVYLQSWGNATMVSHSIKAIRITN